MSKASLVCLKHQIYDGTTPPTLSCKTCCHIFVARLRDSVAQKQAAREAHDWLATKKEDRQRETTTIKRRGSILKSISNETVSNENL